MIRPGGCTAGLHVAPGGPASATVSEGPSGPVRRGPRRAKVPHSQITPECDSDPEGRAVQHGAAPPESRGRAATEVGTAGQGSSNHRARRRLSRRVRYRPREHGSGAMGTTGAASAAPGGGATGARRGYRHPVTRARTPAMVGQRGLPGGRGGGYPFAYGRRPRR